MRNDPSTPPYNAVTVLLHHQEDRALNAIVSKIYGNLVRANHIRPFA